MRKIFIDIGGHHGESVEPALNPIFAFDIIYTFEPVKTCCDVIRKIQDDRVKVMQMGLSDKTGEFPIYAPNSVAASLYSDHMHLDSNDVEICQMLEASTFFKENITSDDEVYVKINCEGAECEIIQNLIENKQYDKITKVLIDFDCEKIPSLKHRKHDIMSMLESNNYKNYYFPEEVQYGQGSQMGGITNYLVVAGASEKKLEYIYKSFLFHVHNLKNRKHMGFYKFKIVKYLPASFMNFYYKYIK